MHWLHWIILPAVLFDVSLLRHNGFAGCGYLPRPERFRFGWPLIFHDRLADGQSEHGWLKFGYLLLADHANAMILVVLLAGTMFAIERFLRHPKTHLQFRTTDLFLVLCVAAGLFAVMRVRHFDVDLPLPPSLGIARLILNDRHTMPELWLLASPTLFAIACTLYSIAWLFMCAVRSTVRLMQHPFAPLTTSSGSPGKPDGVIN